MRPPKARTAAAAALACAALAGSGCATPAGPQPSSAQAWDTLVTCFEEWEARRVAGSSQSLVEACTDAG